MGSKRFHFKTIDSTSAYLVRRRFALPHLTLVSADEQTAGRGRLGRAWQSQRGKNLLCSVLFKDMALMGKHGALSLSAALAVIRTLEHFGVKHVTFKWPNDVYVGGKKICGILLSSVSDEGKIGALVVGVGLNVNQREFDKELLMPPTSLALETGKSRPVWRVKRTLYRELIRTYAAVAAGDTGYLDALREKNYLAGKELYATVQGEKTKVKVLDIGDDNALVVEQNGQILHIIADEVTFH